MPEKKNAAAQPLLQLHPDDNVGIVLSPLEAGDQVEIGGKLLVSPCGLGMGHKLALCKIPDGANIVKYAFEN